MIELLLALFVIVAVGAIAWPSMQHGYDNFKLKRAADQVVTAFGHARVQAMTKGITEVFRFEPNTPKYTIDPLADDTAPPDADTTTSAGSGASGTSSMTAGPGGAQTSTPGSTCGQLPDGFMFTNIDRAAATEDQLSTTGGGSSSAPPVMFFADGSSTEAVVTIADKNGLSINVTLRGLTSFARVSEITRGDALAK